MRHFILHALDHDDAGARRAAHYDAHKAYLSGALPVRILVSGPVLADTDERPVGSFFLLEAEDREAVDRFHEADPFKAAGIWRQVTIQLFLKRQDNR